MNKCMLKRSLSAILLAIVITIYSKNGLDNLGNTCYMNAVLQAFFACDTLTHAINNPMNKQLLNNQFLKDYADLLHAHQTSQGSISPEGFAECSRVGIKGEQQDAAEYIKNIVDNIGVFISKQEKKLQSDAISDLFYFKVRTYFESRASKTASEETWENICILNFPEVPLASYNFKDLFNNFYAHEIVTDHKEITSRWRIFSSLPEIFIVQLARFGFDKRTMRPSKISIPVLYDLSDLDVKSQEGSSKYKPVACVLHSGNFGAGHYMAVVRYGNQWYFCDDTSVVEIDIQTVKRIINGEKVILFNTLLKSNAEYQAQAYIYFFELVGKSPQAPLEKNIPKLNQLLNNFFQDINKLYLSIKL